MFNVINPDYVIDLLQLALNKEALTQQHKVQRGTALSLTICVCVCVYVHTHFLGVQYLLTPRPVRSLRQCWVARLWNCTARTNWVSLPPLTAGTKTTSPWLRDTRLTATTAWTHTQEHWWDTLQAWMVQRSEINCFNSISTSIWFWIESLQVCHAYFPPDTIPYNCLRRMT